jgi:hypothetical protein
MVFVLSCTFDTHRPTGVCITVELATVIKKNAKVKFSLSVLGRHIMGTDVWLHLFLALAPDAGKWPN